MTEPKSIPVIIGTAGHVDHGKTSLIKALTGTDTDRLVEEKERGVSIELGFAPMELGPPGDRVTAAVVDVPGHERFIRNMLAGATGMDMVLFVVAADDGVMPQTLEHLDIVRLLGVGSGVFVVTKCDLAAPERAREVEADLRRLASGTRLEGAPVVRVSTVTGEGVEELKSVIFEHLPTARATASGLFRLPVDRSFAIKGFGTVVTGTVASGTIAKGDGVFIYPSGISTRVRALQSLHSTVDMVVAGQRAAVNLASLGHREVGRGDVLAAPELERFAPPAFRSAPRAGSGKRATTGARLRVDCSMELLGGPGRDFRPVKNNSTLKLHHLTDSTLVKLQLPARKEARPGESLFGRLILAKPLLMLRGDRFVLRDPATNTTIGGGEVCVPHLASGFISRIGRLKPPAPPKDDTPEAATASVLDWLLPQNAVGFELKGIAIMLNMSAPALEGLIKDAGLSGYALVDGFVASTEKVEAAKRAVLAGLAAFHAREPAAAGMSEAELLGTLKKGFGGGLGEVQSAELLRAVLGRMEGQAVREGSTIRAAAHTRGLTGADAVVEASILALFSGLEPVTAEALKRLRHPAGDVDRVLKYLLENGTVIKLKEGTYLSGAAVERARELLLGHFSVNRTIRAAEFRDILGCGRKLAIEILEYFDRIRVTLRAGDERTLR